MWLKLSPLVLSPHRSRCSARKEAFSGLSVQHLSRPQPKLLTVHYFEFGNLIGQRTANRRAVFSLVSPEAWCDVTEASTECNGAVARSRRFSDVMQALMECKWRRRRRGLGSILLLKVVPVAHSPYYIRHIVR